MWLKLLFNVSGFLVTALQKAWAEFYHRYLIVKAKLAAARADYHRRREEAIRESLREEERIAGAAEEAMAAPVTTPEGQAADLLDYISDYGEGKAPNENE
jgi:hypothetical protein